MKSGKIVSISLVILLVLNFAGRVEADIVEFNLLDLGCPTFFDHNSSSWSISFDPEETFSDISHIYIDWSGEFTGALGLYLYPDPRVPPDIPPPPPPEDPCIPYPTDVALRLTLHLNNLDYFSGISGGESSYPAPEPLAEVSELTDLATWVPLDPYISLGYSDEIFFTTIVKHGSITLNSATLIVEGTVIPEPATILILALGAVALRRNKRQYPPPILNI